jgi:hypothetical protein
MKAGEPGSTFYAQPLYVAGVNGGPSLPPRGPQGLHEDRYRSTKAPAAALSNKASNG